MDGVSDLEDSIHVLSSILQISGNQNKAELVKNIRRNVPGLRKFDQVIWLYELSPGTWQYKTIFESVSSGDEGSKIFRIIPNKELITKIISKKIFADDRLKIATDLPGMRYEQVKNSPNVMERPFAFVKVIQKGNSKAGVLLGVSRADKLFDDKGILQKETILSLRVKDKSSGSNLFSLNKNGASKKVFFNQEYSFSIADSEWQVAMEFTKDDNMVFMERMPYLVLFFGIILTAVGILFVRNNHKQSERVSLMNKALEKKNLELENQIVERERLNKALAKADKDNRAVIDSVSDVIFETDTEGTILFLSEAWRRITGFDPKRSLGNNLFSMLHPDDQGKQSRDFEMLVKGQKQSYRSFTRVRTSDGRFRSVELAISMIRKNEDNSLRVVGTITDVEERRRAERALSEAEKKYRAIVENAAGGLYQLTPEGIYLSANPSMARILGYDSVDDLLHMVKDANTAVYIDKDEREAFINALVRAGQINGYETQVYKKNKEKIWVSENIRCVKDENDNLLYFEGSIEDITKRKQAEIALKEAKVQSDMANRTKTEFIANMSHELRTPLNAIIGFSEIMKNEVMGPLGVDMYREYSADIYGSGKRLLKIINEILDISKIEAGDRELNESEFSFADVLKSCIDLQAANIRDKRITLTDNTKNLPTIIGEELAVKQTIINILSNAVKYTPENGQITIFSTYDHNGDFRFSISDTGMGLTREEIQKAFSPFGQIDNSLDRSGSGSGLGLTLSKSMMKLHGGDLEILSEKGIGTTVSLIFPVDRVGRLNDEVEEDKNSGDSGDKLGVKDRVEDSKIDTAAEAIDISFFGNADDDTNGGE